jgi:acetyl esterase/lipase
LEISNFKKLVEKAFQNPPRRKKPLVPGFISKNFSVSQFMVCGKYIVTLQPKVDILDIHILFFHGGAYLLEGSSMHWKMNETIVRETNCKVSYIDYPLAPEFTYIDTFEMVQQSFDLLTKQFPNDKFMFMGDSAGGGLALAFAQKLVKENAQVQPIKNILFSPWLDLSMQNPEIKIQELVDKLLLSQGLIEAGRKYAGGEDVSDYLLSPINGDFGGIGKTLVFYGTHELFYPDCKKLKEKTQDYVNFTFHEFPEMQHDWVIFPIPEAKEALNIAIEFIKK